MRINLVVAMAILVSACAGGTPASGDIERFIARRDLCDHLRGEIDDVDSVDQRELIARTNKTCAGTDAELAELKKRYADSPEAIGMLNSYEANIEPRR